MSEFIKQYLIYGLTFFANRDLIHLEKPAYVSDNLFEKMQYQVYESHHISDWLPVATAALRMEESDFLRWLESYVD